MSAHNNDEIDVEIDAPHHHLTATHRHHSTDNNQTNQLHQRTNSRTGSRTFSSSGGSPFDRSTRASRNSTGAKEELTMDLKKDVIQEDEQELSKDDKNEKALMFVFCSMVMIGLGNKVFNKLMTIPMYNYPNFLNLLTTFVYIPVCFAYIIPMAYYGYIPPEQFEVPKRKFAVMGALDAMAGIMQIFGATYLPGPLIILLLQAAIPVTMIISKYLLAAQYNKYQYAGALTVAGGIMVVLGPQLTGGGSIIWAIVLILSTVPMALSSVYKEIALGETELDAVYLNGWVAVFQFLFSLILCVPSSLVSEPPVPISGLPQNMLDGLKCYVGISTITCDDDGCTSDRCNPQAPEFVNTYLFFNQLYNLLIILILKYGNANLLYLALTLMVPLGNVAFTLPFIPGRTSLQITDIIGLIVICSGLGIYRFAAKFIDAYFNKRKFSQVPQNEDEAKVNLFTTLLPVTEEDGDNQT